MHFFASSILALLVHSAVNHCYPVRSFLIWVFFVLFVEILQPLLTKTRGFDLADLIANLPGKGLSAC